jgi:hypothetical protein
LRNVNAIASANVSLAPATGGNQASGVQDRLRRPALWEGGSATGAVEFHSSEQRASR